ncbi:hypothetical protein JCM8115_005072 [Rhodotorula mucilaginosa]|uniref:Uncharacterized protein n=1 Tax=Rhodotorula mucilaginosa TaxID=5537 RepID=A0A9P6W927_RHOMI|nr:hypothetical protein C6P46_000138 [Rhodotorula mucilaginosa]TKA58468.1 hypothetical protein B0A53_00207 [Rhodotorula sp. CCFEE 5036]
MPEQQQQPNGDREPTVSEISAAGAPNYRGRAIHPQVQIDDKGLMYIGPIPASTYNKRTVSVPVKVVALGEQGQEQYAVHASDDDDHLFELVVTSDPDLLCIDRQSTTTSDGARTPWLTVPAKNLSYVKVTVNRWQDGKEGSDVLIAAVFKAEDRPKPVVLLLEVDTQHHDTPIAPPENTPVRRIDSSFDPNALEHIKAFFLSWQQKDYCRTEIDLTRALAVPPPGQSLSSRPPIPEGYDPYDSTTWVAAFGPVSGDQEALYLDDASRKKEKATATAGGATTAKAAGKGKGKAKDKNAVGVAQVGTGPGPGPEASTNATATAFTGHQSVAGPSPDDEPTVVITQSGRTVKSIRRVHLSTSAIDSESAEEEEEEDDDAARKAPLATTSMTKAPRGKARAKVQVGATSPAAAGAKAGPGPEASSSSSARRNGASSSSSAAQKSVTPEQATPIPPASPPPPRPAAAAAPVVITQSGRTVKTRTVHFPSSFDMGRDTDNDAARKYIAAAAMATDPRRKSKARPKTQDKVAAIAGSSGAQSIGSAAEAPPPPPTPAAAEAPVVITQSGRTVKTRLVHSLPSDSDDDDAAEADAEEAAAAADEFSPPPPRRGSSSRSKKKKPPAKRSRVGRKDSEPIVAVAAGDDDGNDAGGGGTQEGSGRRTKKWERAQEMEVDRDEEQVLQQGGEVAEAATTNGGGFAADRQEQQQQQQQGEVVAQEAGWWPIMDRLPFALPPLPLSTPPATGAAGYQQQQPPPPQQQHQQQQLDETPTSLVDFDTTKMTTRSSSRRPGGASAADSGASTAFR